MEEERRTRAPSRFLSVDGDDEKADGDIHEEDGVEGQGLPPRPDGGADEWVGRPGAPHQRYRHDDELDDGAVLEHADDGARVQREKAVAEEAEALEEDDVTSLRRPGRLQVPEWGRNEDRSSKGRGAERLTRSSTFRVRITAPAARTAKATANTSDWEAEGTSSEKRCEQIHISKSLDFYRLSDELGFSGSNEKRRNKKVEGILQRKSHPKSKSL